MDIDMGRVKMTDIVDGLETGKCIHLIRFREADGATHSFEFQLLRKKHPQFRFIERFENDRVQEEFLDLDAVLVMCNWLLYLKFDVNIISPYTGEDN
tara:strand:+ start:248 stop:538 length:291 start_codon:yes stop_codon:yes gene_type:complete